MRLRATVTRLPKDTAQFALPVAAYRCTDGRALLLQAAAPGGNGVLVRLQYGDSLAPGVYPIVTPGDTGTRGAMVAIRYVIREAARSFWLDSGAVDFTRTAPALDAAITGAGIDAAFRASTVVQIEDVPVPLPSDTIQCRYEP